MSGGGNESLNVPKEARVVLTDRFDAFKPVVLSTAVAAQLGKRGIDADKLRQRQCPSGWEFAYGDLPSDVEFGKRDNGFFVGTEKRCKLFGPAVGPENRKYFIKWTIGVPKDARGKRSKVELGICQNGQCARGSKFLQTVKLKPGERKTAVIAIDFKDELPDFRPLARVAGDVNFEEVVVMEGPDDLAATGLTLVEGTLEECSAIPDPKKSDYSDCRFVCHFTGNSIIKGAPCPQNLSLVVEAFANHKLLGTSRLKAGDKVRCLVMPFEKLPEERKSTQQADDLNLFTLPSYYAVGIQAINDFIEYPQLAAPASGIFFTDAKKEYVSVFERHINPPLTEEERRLQAEAIQADLAKINAMLAEYTPEKREALRLAFDKAWEAEKKKDAPGFNRVHTDRYGVCVWRNIDNSFWALPENYRLNVEESRLSADKIDALVALRDFFEANGCQFIVSLVPNLYEISARVINKEFRQVPDFQTAYVVKQLLENGIETVYGAYEIVGTYNRYPMAYSYPEDGHPTDTVQDVMTDFVAKKLYRYHFSNQLDKRQFTFENTPYFYRGKPEAYSFPKNCDIGRNKPGDAYLCREVLYNGQTASAIALDLPQSPFLVIGNSYIGAPKRMFPTFLVSKLGVAVSTKAKAGYGAMTTLIQDIFASPERALVNKKVVVLHVGVRRFLDDYRFNNIRQMDEIAQSVAAKSLIDTLAIANPLDIAETQKDVAVIKKDRKKAGGNIFQLPPNGELSIVSEDLTKCDFAKEIAVVVPTGRSVRQNVKYMINGKLVEIPSDYKEHKITNVMHRLPAGTKRLEIKAVGTPGAVFVVRDVQLYQ